MRRRPSAYTSSFSAGGDAAAPAGPGTLDIGAQDDPDARDYLNRVKGRMDSDEDWSGQAIDKATSKIRDATEGRRKALRGMMARRGVLGDTSVPELSEAALSAQEGRDVNAAATDIALGRERDKDAFMLGSQGAFMAPGQMGLANRRMGLDAWQTAENARLARESMAMQQWMAQLNATMSALSSL